MAGQWQRTLRKLYPENIPITDDTWRRLPDPLRLFYRGRELAPTELAARVLLNDAFRAPKLCAGSQDWEQLTRGRPQVRSGRGKPGPKTLPEPRRQPESVQASAGSLSYPFRRGISSEKGEPRRVAL